LREASECGLVGDVETGLLLDSAVSCCDTDGRESEGSEVELLSEVLRGDPVDVDRSVEEELGGEDSDFVYLSLEGKSKVEIRGVGDVGGGDAHD
jgi:hypothetical protein